MVHRLGVSLINHVSHRPVSTRVGSTVVADARQQVHFGIVPNRRFSTESVVRQKKGSGYVNTLPMGVYVFRIIDTDWIKVGHHKVTASRPNVYYRVAARGFHSLVHPPELEGRLGIEHMELLAWFPTLGLRHETDAHEACKTNYGEFHNISDLETVLKSCESNGGVQSYSSSEDKELALSWAETRSRR